METMRLDPLVAGLLRAALALLFASAALHKARRPRSFVSTLADYEILPRGALWPAVFVLIGLESSLAIGLVASPRPEPSMAALALLIAYGGAIGLNLLRGRNEIDCGCLGPAARRPLSWGLVARNLVLAGGAAATVLPTTGRALHAIDALSFVGGLATTILIFQALQLLAVHSGSFGVREEAR